MNWTEQISELTDPKIIRIRRTINPFRSPFKDREIPLDKPIPKDNGFCRRPLPRDHLYVVGITDNNHPKKIHCGYFSEELLDRIKNQITANQGMEPTSANAQSVVPDD